MKKLLTGILFFVSCFGYAQDAKMDFAKKDTIPKINAIKIYPYSKNTIRFGDRLEVHGQNFQKLLDKNTTNPIVLFLDNYKLTTIVGDVIDDSTINFTMDSTLDATDQDKDFWASEYKTALKEDGRVKSVLKIGKKDGSLISKPYEGIYVNIYNQKMKLIISWIFIILSLVLIWAAMKTDILRENCQCNCTDKTKKGRKPFSLSRSQMALWTIIVAFSFTYIYLITGEMPDITEGTLILLGISSTTTLGGSLIDSNDKTAKKENAPADRCCSEGFIIDILSDGGMPGIHRLQNVLFTIILAIIYINNAVNDLELTNFSTNLLLLMGISSGTYLGVKYFANQTLAKNGAQQQAATDRIKQTEATDDTSNAQATPTDTDK